MTTATADTAPAAYLVLAQVLLGSRADPILDKGLYCSIECASSGVRELTQSIGQRERASALILDVEDRPVGCVITRSGQMWMIQILASHELPDLH